MKRRKLDKADEAVKKFFRSLRLGVGGIELELDGKVIGKIIPANQLSPAEAKALVEERWALIRQAQELNKGVPARVIEREVREAVEEVRRRQR
jgi:hypothetical protein